MKIFVTGLRGIPGLMGGVEGHCEELLPRIKRSRPELDITVLARRPYMGSRRSRFEEVDVRALPAPRTPSSEAIVATFLATLYAWAKGANLLHIHAIGPGLLAPLARLLGMRVIVTHHGADYNRGKWGSFASFMLRLGEHASMAWANRVIAVSPSLQRKLARDYPRHAGKLHYIPNGAPEFAADDGEAERVLARHALRPGGFVLAVGRMVPEKGFDYLIDAIEAQGGSPPLLLVGGGDHHTAYVEQLRAKASDRIIFAGMLSRATLLGLYKRAALFVLPSFHEGLPISALEAGCSGTPSLLSDIDANKDVGLADANYFPVGDGGALADRLGRDPRVFAVDAEAIRRKFDWDEIAASTLAIYEQVGVGGRSR